MFDGREGGSQEKQSGPGTVLSITTFQSRYCFYFTQNKIYREVIQIEVIQDLSGKVRLRIQVRLTLDSALTYCAFSFGFLRLIEKGTTGMGMILGIR